MYVKLINDLYTTRLILTLILVGGKKLQDAEYIVEKCSDLIQTVNTGKHYEIMAQSFTSITVTLCIHFTHCNSKKEL